MLEFNIRNQEISRIDNFSPAEKSVKYLIAKFNFKTEDWNEAIKRAIFRNVKSKVEKDAMLEGDSCTVPWEVLVGSGDIEVSVHGISGTKDITTDVAMFDLNRTLQGGSATQEPSPTVYEQMLKKMQQTKEIAQSVRDDADNGEFNGPQGPPGKDGKDGKDGDDGDDGKSAYDYAVEGGFKGTEQEFIDLMAQAGHVDLTGYVTKEEHEEELLKTMVKVTTDKAPFHHITDSANMKVLDFGMEGKTEQDGIPTPENKVEIVNAGVYNEETGRYEHKCCVGNKNLFDVEKAKDESAYEYDGGTMPYAHFPVYVGKGNTVTFSCILPSNDSVVPFNTALISDGVDGKVLSYFWYKNNSAYTHNVVTVTSPNDYIYLRFTTSDKLVWLDYFNDIHIEYDTSKTTYTPHASQPFTITSDRPLTMWDKLVKRDGVWGWSANNGKRIFDGTENWEEYGAKVELAKWDIIPVIQQGYSVLKGAVCNVCTESTSVDKITISNTFSIHNSNWILFHFNISVADWKAYLAEQYANGTPVYIIYPTAEEQSFHPLPDEEQTLLNNLETYYGVTNVYNEQGCPMWLTYVADQELHWNQKLLQIQQALI